MSFRFSGAFLNFEIIIEVSNSVPMVRTPKINAMSAMVTNSCRTAGDIASALTVRSNNPRVIWVWACIILIIEITRRLIPLEEEIHAVDDRSEVGFQRHDLIRGLRQEISGLILNEPGHRQSLDVPELESLETISRGGELPFQHCSVVFLTQRSDVDVHRPSILLEDAGDLLVALICGDVEGVLTLFRWRGELLAEQLRPRSGLGERDDGESPRDAPIHLTVELRHTERTHRTEVFLILLAECHSIASSDGDVPSVDEIRAVQVQIREHGWGV